ncbi:MAG: metallophosphoesterase family protein [Muribaculaceae bacterium]|nr:metallophosphoesterase family protein [Muribaculaceae bacterium]
MKLIGILSDTHSAIDERFRTHLAHCDEIWHAGDIGCDETLMFLQSLGPTVRAVHGNIDHGNVRRLCPGILEFHVEGVKVFMTHIGGYPGRWAPGIKQRLITSRPNLMVDGHSHLLKVIYDHELNLLHINPGAAGTHGWQQVSTLVRLTIDGTNMRDLEVIELGRLKL